MIWIEYVLYKNKEKHNSGALHLKSSLPLLVLCSEVIKENTQKREPKAKGRGPNPRAEYLVPKAAQSN